MNKMLRKFASMLVLVPAFAFTASLVAVPAVTVFAAGDCSTLTIDNGAACAKGTSQATNLFGANGVFQAVVNILLFLIGSISVIMLVIGGIRYVLSGGDQSAVTAAKNTILYAIVGIIVAFLAYGAVQFVTSSLINNTTTQ